MAVAEKHPHLPAIERDWAVRLRANSALMRQIHAAVNGPFHLVHPATFASNLCAFQRVLTEQRVNGDVYYGKKANKASCWLSEVARMEGCVDVASVPEFVHSLANGIRGDQIGITGAAKSERLLWLAARHGALVAIDALDELERAIRIAADGERINILLRVLPPKAPNSRFGLNQQELEHALKRCLEACELVAMKGFSFHLDGYAVAPRAALAHQLIDTIDAARALGLTANTLSIGGGFACAYVTENDWQRFNAAYSPELFHADKQFAGFYPYYQAPTGAAMLREILMTPGPEQTTLAARLNQHRIRLLLEPGRALLDGAGMSVFPVQGYKHHHDCDHGIVTVNGLSMSLSEQWKNSEFLPDPLLLQCGAERDQIPTRAAIGGASCMEYDVLSWRKIPFAAPPRHGDLILYPNTAGYQMDKNESEFHQLPLPPKVVVREREGDTLWSLDQ
ncbi:hypothetical protein [Carnimonas bestiolae]|uniref:hypothetical protein n=1 Tax=Carnimonas bestiolae TaxID=3402172 RepID=UPI003EDBF9FC